MFCNNYEAYDFKNPFPALTYLTVIAKTKQNQWQTRRYQNTGHVPLEAIGKKPMTYNFDPDRWYEIELRAIYTKFMAGLSTQEAYERSIIELDQKLEDMWKRLDGTYPISK